MRKKNHRTIEHLRRRLKGRIYIKCRSLQAHRMFLMDAECEGYRVGDRTPTEADMRWDIIALEKDRKLCYCGFADHLAFKLDDNAYRIDYERYSGGVRDYLWHDDRHKVISFNSEYFGECQISGRRTDEALSYYREQIRYYDAERGERILFAEMEHVFKVLVTTERGKQNDRTDIVLLS